MKMKRQVALLVISAFLLSLDEAMNPIYEFSSDYLKYDESRRTKNTEYAKGAWMSIYTEYAGNGSGNGWIK